MTDMAEITELEQRLSAALGRLGAVLERGGGGGPDLHAALSEAEAQRDTLAARLAATEMERDSALRKADRAEADLEALRRQRETERAELDRLIAALAPLIDGPPRAAPETPPETEEDKTDARG